MHLMGGGKKTVIVSNNESFANLRDYSTIIEALYNGTEIRTNVRILVMPGTYDIEQEFRDFFGADFFDLYTDYSDRRRAGYFLGRDVELIGVGNVELVFNYTGGQANVLEYFSPINTTSNNLVENITISVGSENCRYHIHDDFAANDIGHAGTNIFRRLRFNGRNWKHTVMGCGMGISNIYIIENCYFNTDYCNISYHNSIVTDKVAVNKLYITNCYGNGYVMIKPLGSTTEITKCYVNGCRFENLQKEMVSISIVDNMEYVIWNTTEFRPIK